MEDVTERRYMVMEAIIGLKHKVSKDVSEKRVESSMSSTRERAAWKQTKKVNGMHLWVK